MKFFFAAMCALSAAASAFCVEESAAGWAEYDFEESYCDVQASLLLPQGGTHQRRRGGATARLGWYAGDFLAIEGSLSCLEDAAGFGLRGLWHWWGYEKFDPFFTFGACGATSGLYGPCAGWGCFWHFDDNWSLRFDAEAALGLDGCCETFYAFSTGLQYAF